MDHLIFNYDFFQSKVGSSNKLLRHKRTLVKFWYFLKTPIYKIKLPKQQTMLGICVWNVS